MKKLELVYNNKTDSKLPGYTVELKEMLKELVNHVETKESTTRQEIKILGYVDDLVKELQGLPKYSLEQMAEFSVFSVNGKLVNRPDKKSDYRYVGRSYDLGLEMINGEWKPK